MTTPAIRRQYIERLFRDNGIVELRLLGGQALSGLYDDLEAFMADARRYHDHGAVYTSLNAPTPRTVSNQLGKDKALCDSDIGWITRLPFDFDPVRPSGTNSTEPELEYAYDARNRLVNWLSALGWPAPIRACSGNGFHAQYRVKLPANPETKAVLSRVYLGLGERFSDDRAHFDTTVRNPSRIFRLYGTVNRKGPHSVERPHRISDVLMPTTPQVVTEAQIRALADRLTPEQVSNYPTLSGSGEARNGTQAAYGRGDYATLDVVRWFLAHQAYRRMSEVLGKHYVECPWKHQHTTACSNGTDTIIFESDGGWPGFFCSHAHCDGRNIRDVMALWGDADAFCARTFGGAA